MVRRDSSISAGRCLRGARFADVGIPKNVLAHMNLTTGISPGNVAMLKDNGVLDWPMALRQPEFKPLETQLGLKQAMPSAIF